MPFEKQFGYTCERPLRRGDSASWIVEGGSRVPMGQPGLETHLHIRAAFIGKDVHALFRSALGRSRKNNVPHSDAEVVASYSTKDQTLTLSSILYGRLPVEFLLKENSRSYASFLRMLLEELRRLSSEEKASGISEHESSVAQLTQHMEAKIRSLVGVSPRDVAPLGHIVEVFRDDVKELEPQLPVHSLGARHPLFSRQRLHSQGFRIIDNQPEAAQYISGFVSLEVDRVIAAAPASQEVDWRAADEMLKRTFRVQSGRLLSLEGNRAQVEFIFTIPSRFLDDAQYHERLQFLIHWGRFSGSRNGWWDEEISNSQLQRVSQQTYGSLLLHRNVRHRSQTRRGLETIRIQRELDLEIESSSGSFGAVLVARFEGSAQRCWGKIPGIGDLSFQAGRVPSRVPPGAVKLPFSPAPNEQSIFENFERFQESMIRPSRRRSAATLPRKIVDAIRVNPRLAGVFNEYVERIEDPSDSSQVSSACREMVDQTISRFGISSLALIAPEGFHAIAGGLAQVVVGFASVFQDAGIETTIISPLYEEAQGSKHASADEVLRNGLKVNGKTLQIKSRGSIRVPFGPEKSGSDGRVMVGARIAEVEVYEARDRHIRLLFLRHRRLADRLYSPGESDVQIRKAIFLSRGAVELFSDRRFDLSPDLILTNDWLTGLVPAYLQAHPRYRQMGQKSPPVIHLLHNCGRAYQGLFRVNHQGRDLWPLLDLDGEHFFGISDPKDRKCLNLTAAAVYHATGGLLAVSRPYAESLIHVEGGEGLEELFQRKSEMLYGVSNGIDISGLRRFVWSVGERALQELDSERLASERYRPQAMLTRLHQYKMATKLAVQRMRGLRKDVDAPLISFVGRIAEQKGVQLLVEPLVPGGKKSVLECLLEEFPSSQFVFAGPVSSGDVIAENFIARIQELRRSYPDRVSLANRFLPHQEALEITLGSSLFLMPSRYEPGGITQLEALACGTPVVARKVGGIAVTVQQYDEAEKRGTGFLFEEFSAPALHSALRQALSTISNPRHQAVLLRSGALAKNDWKDRAETYFAIFQEAAGVFRTGLRSQVIARRKSLLEQARVDSATLGKR